MEVKDKDLLMVDFAALDRRSFKAHLLGTGDNRVAHYEHLMEKCGDSDLEALRGAYSDTIIDKLLDDEEAGEQTATREPSGSDLGVATGYVLTALIGIFLSAMVYQAVVGWVT